MSQQVVIGGNRIGSGKKMTTELDDYGRSTHNLSEKWASSAAPGVLYPCFVKPVMRGDSFDIEIAADARTLPTKGALFGSYKMQIDMFFCPVRLYQALLHNNPLALGLNMKDVKLPLIEMRIAGEESEVTRKAEFSNSCLLKYLGLSGMGTVIGGNAQENNVVRWFNAIPAIAYYDIFKNYYANKQEENAYVITENTSSEEESAEIDTVSYDFEKFLESNKGTITGEVAAATGINITPYDFFILIIKGKNLSLQGVYIEMYYDDDSIEDRLLYWINKGYFSINKQSDTEIVVTATRTLMYGNERINKIKIYYGEDGKTSVFDDLVAFPLENIDKMRYDILSHHELGTPFIIKIDEDTEKSAYLPYRTLVDHKDGFKDTLNVNPMNGLVVKTYQNDIFNNWLNAEWIEGENGINELTKVEIVDGAFSMDALNFAQKLYNMLNRVAVAGGTYEDWQDVMYEQMKRGNMESPVYLGGMSQDIYFDEVIQTAPAEGKPLGELGGRGKLNGDIKGGKLHAKIGEIGFIIGIVSLTPRIFQTQGNEFYMTELESVDDFHKPALDGIGYQDLIGERLAYFDTQLDPIYGNTQTKIGKLPAWIEYMTSVDKAYGDFADTEGRGYMILNRNYEQDEITHTIKDVTTYIDPSKYNYAFADASLTAQNFWLEIGFNVTARRKMSARIIPNV